MEADLGGQLRRARWLLQQGDSAGALALLTRLDRDHPGRTDVKRTLGIVLSRLGRNEQAEALLREVAGLEPGSPDAASDLANVLLNLDRPDEALEVLSPHLPAEALSAGSTPSPAFLFNLARALKQGGDPVAAAPPLQRILAAQPRHYGALVTLADCEKAMGRIEEAAAHYRAAIAAHPADGTAWWALSNLKAGSFSDAELAQLQALHADDREGMQQVFMEFALASALDQRGRLREAFGHYVKGNRLKRELEPWDREAHHRWLERLRAGMQAVPLPPRPQAMAAPRPVFIVSLPRSGSTLTEQILAAHSQVTAAGELPWIPRVLAAESQRRKAGLAEWAGMLSAGDWQRLGARYLELCPGWARATPVFTDKLPGNISWAAAILAMLPEALIVHLRREAMDVCWSCYRQLFISGSAFAYDLRDLAAYWQDSERQMAWLRERCPDRVLQLDYEALVANPEAETRRLLDFIGLPFESACLRGHEASRAVSTASAAQVREPIHAQGIGHWRRYAGHLAELAEALGRDQ